MISNFRQFIHNKENVYLFRFSLPPKTKYSASIEFSVMKVTVALILSLIHKIKIFLLKHINCLNNFKILTIKSHTCCIVWMLLVNVVWCMHEQVQLPSQNIVYKYKLLMFRFLMVGSMSWPFLTISKCTQFYCKCKFFYYLYWHHLQNFMKICTSAHPGQVIYWELNQASGLSFLTQPNNHSNIFPSEILYVKPFFSTIYIPIWAHRINKKNSQTPGEISK